MTSNKNQHYVPQFYLRGFSDDANLYAYDVKRKCSFSTNIRNLGSENYYHNFPSDLQHAYTDSEEVDFLDKAINKSIENLYSLYNKNYEKMTESVRGLLHGEKYHLDEGSLRILFDYIIIQYIRSSKFRAQCLVYGEKTEKLIMNCKVKLPFGVADYQRIVHLTILHTALCELGYADKQNFVDPMYAENVLLIRKLRRQFDLNKKCFVLNNTVKTFFTSDAPVIIEQGRTVQDNFKLSYFPINQKLGICFFDITQIENMSEYANGILVIDENKIDILDNLNLQMVRNANRFVYNKIMDFEYTKEYIEGTRRSCVIFY